MQVISEASSEGTCGSSPTAGGGGAVQHVVAAQYSLLHLGVKQGTGQQWGKKKGALLGGVAQQPPPPVKRISSASVALSCPHCKSRVGLWSFAGPRPAPVGRVVAPTRAAAAAAAAVGGGSSITAAGAAPAGSAAAVAVTDASQPAVAVSASLSMTIAGGAYRGGGFGGGGGGNGGFGGAGSPTRAPLIAPLSVSGPFGRPRNQGSPQVCANPCCFPPLIPRA